MENAPRFFVPNQSEFSMQSDGNFYENVVAVNQYNQAIYSQNSAAKVLGAEVADLLRIEDNFQPCSNRLYPNVQSNSGYESDFNVQKQPSSAASNVFSLGTEKQLIRTSPTQGCVSSSALVNTPVSFYSQYTPVPMSVTHSTPTSATFCQYEVSSLSQL